MLHPSLHLKACFYANEDSVLLKAGYSRTLQKTIEDRYSFFGGAHDEWVKYFKRADLPHNIWHFLTHSEVVATAGVSAVAKKDPSQQRKLIMACAANYCWQDVKIRLDHGLGGSAALARIQAVEPGLHVAFMDESNAFTSMVVPQWMIKYLACPPVLSGEIWEKLTLEQRQAWGRFQVIYPSYGRLPMGSSHSVHILMSINLHRFGNILTSRFRQYLLPSIGPQTLAQRHVWIRRGRVTLHREELGLFRQLAIDSRRAPLKTLVVLILFSGPRVTNDLSQLSAHLRKEELHR